MCKNIFLLVLLLTFTGCSGIDWFPEYHREPTTPDQFTFPTKTGVEIGATVTSDPITVAGLTADSSPVSVSGPNDSKYSINEGAATSTAGTVKNGDKVTVSHTSSSIPNGGVTSTLIIGNISGNFTSITRLVSTPNFTSTNPAPPFAQVVSGTMTASDISGHTMSIKDSAGTADAFFGVAAPGASDVFFRSGTQFIPFLNGQLIWVRNTQANVAAGVTTTLTIDGIDFPVPLK